MPRKKTWHFYPQGFVGGSDTDKFREAMDLLVFTVVNVSGGDSITVTWNITIEGLKTGGLYHA